jgi:transcriptional regulator with XRE-family HTH domain
MESFFTELGCRDEIYGEAAKRVIAWQLQNAMENNSVSKAELAKRMGTSRTQVERVLNPQNVAISLETLDKAARAVGKTLKIEFVDVA